MEPPVEPRRGRRRTRSTRALTDGVDLRSPRAALVRQESQKEAKRTRRALDEWHAAQAELDAIEAELRSTRGAIAALQPGPEPEPEPEMEMDMPRDGLLTGRPAAAVTAAREQLVALRRHHERCRSLLANPPVAPSPGRASGSTPVAEVVAEEEEAQRKRRAQLTKVSRLVASIEGGQIDPEDLVGVGPTKEEMMRDILPVVVPRRDRVPQI
jgi:hypothetical protein